MAEPTETTPMDEIAGKMILEFRSNAEGAVYPVVSFDPVGRITMALIERNLGHVYKQIQIAQVEARSAPPTRRRRAA